MFFFGIEFFPVFLFLLLGIFIEIVGIFKESFFSVVIEIVIGEQSGLVALALDVVFFVGGGCEFKHFWGFLKLFFEDFLKDSKRLFGHDIVLISIDES